MLAQPATIEKRVSATFCSDMTTPAACPSCGTLMTHERFAHRMRGDIGLDICWDCHAIWFDRYESAQLAPAAVLALFRKIHEHREQTARALREPMRCPRCPATLVLTHDLQRSNRLRYHRCPSEHGRLTTFMQFLREKEFVRSLSASEIDTLKATVAQVSCSSCGAVVDLARDTSCGYCRSPLAILDAEAVEKALAALSEAEQRRTAPPPTDMAKAFESLLAAYKTPKQESSVWMREVSATSDSRDVVDLVVAGIGQLFKR